MPSFTSMDEIYKHIEKKMKEALLDDVTSKTSEIMIEQINETVYDAYSPNTNAEDYYHRRQNEDALGDPSNIGGVMVGNTLEVINATQTNPDIYINHERYDSQNEGDYLTPIIEYGQGYDFASENGNAGYERPRPFISNTREQLKSTGAHVTALKKGLKKRGINVE